MKCAWEKLIGIGSDRRIPNFSFVRAAPTPEETFREETAYQGGLNKCVNGLEIKSESMLQLIMRFWRIRRSRTKKIGERSVGLEQKQKN
jgi:hypothetical protein